VTSYRVAVTRREDDDGPLTSALRVRGLVPIDCPVLQEVPPADAALLRAAVDRLGGYDWVMVASARAVSALREMRRAPWPAGVRSAAVGRATARALEDAGASPPPLVAPTAGAEALSAFLAPLDAWHDRRVLVLTTAGGRTTLTDALAAAGARVDAVEAYRMIPCDPGTIRADWTQAAPEGAVLTSARAVDALVGAIGRQALLALRCVVALGQTTAQRLDELGVSCAVAPEASFDAAAETMAQALAAGTPGPRTARPSSAP
jgi:uroporphyrinogen-III synthase